MLPPSLAIGWTLWRRHRWGLLLLLGYLFAAGTVAALLPVAHLTPYVVNVVFAALISPLYLLVVYLVAVLCKGFDADLNAPGSCFPPGMLTLPVRTGALAGWHLAYGAAAAGMLWLAAAWFILRPWLGLWGLTVPLWWPAVLAAALVAWVQALLWLPFGLGGLRIVLATVILTGMPDWLPGSSRRECRRLRRFAPRDVRRPRRGRLDRSLRGRPQRPPRHRAELGRAVPAAAADWRPGCHGGAGRSPPPLGRRCGSIGGARATRCPS